MTIKAALAVIFVCASSVFSLKGDDCKLSNDETGQCVILRNCTWALDLIKQSVHPNKICRFEGFEPVVCCKKSSTVASLSSGPFTSVLVPPKKSVQKCREYHPQESSQPYETIGYEAFPKEFPHMASIGFEKEKGDEIQWYCGGTLISENYVLTAGHCLKNIYSRDVARWVRLGDINLKNNSGYAEIFYITSKAVYPEFKPPILYHDIGLAKLDRKVTSSDYVRPICFYTADYNVPKDSKAVIIGWGSTGVSGNRTIILNKATLDFFTLEECKKTYKEDTATLPNGILDNYQLCAGDRDGTDGACQGDSGGPLQIFDGKFYLVGITSFGKAKCGATNVPDVFTRVSYYVTWIESVVWPNKN